ncbi:MAG: 2-oxoacid:acceptor oxidoreductase family protein, partial [Desulfurococcales archaeon]|nr:2-oxoacid:acceptor oxidoreductase family protein [Desulfurococcales archaeon]
GDVASPLIPVGRANIMLALELLEAVRYIKYMRHDSLAIVNRKLIKPNIPGVKVEKEENLVGLINSKVKYAYFTDATSKALEEGNPVGANMVVLGFLGSVLERAGILSEGLLGQYAERIGRGNLALINKKLYEWGYSLASKEVSSEVVEAVKLWFQKELL